MAQLGGLLNGVTGLVSGATGAVTGLVDGVAGGALGSVTGVVDGAAGGSNPVSGLVDGGSEGLLNPVTGLVDDLGGTLDDTLPLDLKEVQGVTAGAFKDAYDFYKKNAVGDPKTREAYLAQLRNELAEYKEGEDGTKSVTSGLLKNFTDENYQAALDVGEESVSATLRQLNSTQFPNFEAFKVAREKAAAALHSQLQSNVAYPELSERLLKGLEDLSTKVGLQFGVSAAEREKEQLLMQGGRKNIAQQKKSAELQEALMNSQQIQSNVETEKRLLAEQNEKQAREWKSRVDLESKLRQDQIAADLKAGFDDRANRLRSELAGSTDQTMQMMMQMQKEARESQEKLTQLLTMESRQQPPPPPVVARPQGLLTSILTPVTSLVDNLLGALI